MSVGFIGTGTMGLPMARHLLTARHDMHVYDMTSNRLFRVQRRYFDTQPSR